MSDSSLVVDIECISSVTPDHRAAVEEMAAKRHGFEGDADDYASLCPPLARVVCIGVMALESGKLGCLYDATAFARTAGSHALPAHPNVRGYSGEAALLTSFTRMTERYEHLVTYNGRGYDLPVLIHRSAVHTVEPSQLVVAAAREHRYHPRLHHDLQEIFTSFGASGRFPLRAYGIAYGLGDCKAEGEGGQVAELVAAGEVEKVTTYCMSDVRFTAELFKRWANLRLIPNEGRTFQVAEAVA